MKALVIREHGQGTEVIRFEAPADGRALAVRIREEPSEPLQVVPVPATAVVDVEALQQPLDDP